MSENLSNHEAARRMITAPETVAFPILRFMTYFDVSDVELRAEAASGRLVVTGEAFNDGPRRGFKNLAVSALALSLWLSHPNTPQKFKDHFDRLALTGGPRQQ